MGKLIGRRPMPAEEHRLRTDARFSASYSVSVDLFWNGTPCWLWHGPLHASGFALFAVKKQKMLAHRFSYKKFLGEIPTAHKVVQACPSRTCVNPEHLVVKVHVFHKAKNAILELAKANGSPRYHTGLPCVRGHISDRITHTTRCVKCVQEDAKKVSATKAGKFSNKLKRIRYASQHPSRMKEFRKRWEQKQKLKQEAIAGRPRPDACEICTSNDGGIVFDHCHKTGLFRGWLCNRCNRILGSVKDSPELLMALRDYLLKSTQRSKEVA